MPLIAARLSRSEYRLLTSRKKGEKISNSELVRGLMMVAIERNAINPHYPYSLDPCDSRLSQFAIEVDDDIYAKWRELCDREGLSISKGLRQLLWGFQPENGQLPVFRNRTALCEKRAANNWNQIRYSLALRNQILTAWQNGEGSNRALARRFSVSAGFVDRLVAGYRRELEKV